MRTIRRLLNAFNCVLVVVVVAAAVLLVGVRVFGLTPYTVLSGSMEPTYPTGSLIYVRDAEKESLEVGDPITYVLNDGGVIVTHRIIEIDSENGCVYTKGDANETPDGSPVLYENIIGTPEFCVPKLGYLSAMISRPPGLYIACGIAAAAVIGAFLPDLLIKDKSEKKKNQKKTANA